MLGIVLVLGSVLLGARLVSAAGRTRPIVRATHDLAAGTLLTAADVELAQVQLPDPVGARYLGAASGAVGRRLNRPVSVGELVPADALGEARAQTTVTVPLPAGAAPQLRRGERIEVWVSTASCASVVLLADVVVQSVREAGESFGSGTGGQDVVISVPPEQADRVVAALALDAVRLRAGVLTGPVRGSLSLPNLAGCASAPSG